MCTLNFLEALLRFPPLSLVPLLREAFVALDLVSEPEDPGRFLFFPNPFPFASAPTFFLLIVLEVFARFNAVRTDPSSSSESELSRPCALDAAIEHAYAHDVPAGQMSDGPAQWLAPA